MKEIYVNLKRFDVPKEMGGICPSENPVRWICDTIQSTIENELGKIPDVAVTYFLPEALFVPALDVLSRYNKEEIGNFSIGCQGVFREDVISGKNFGAFTANRPAAAMKALGCSWTMIGHSEERKDKLEILTAYDEKIKNNTEVLEQAELTVSAILNQEVCAALDREMNVLFCVGETAEQKASDIPSEYEPRVKKVLYSQLVYGLKGIIEKGGNCKIAIGYEPIWAIGPGKIPPNGDYVSFVSSYIKEICKTEFGMELSVVYGGGLKEENASEMAAVKTLDGGLVALTKFTQPIAFDVNSLKNIIGSYVSGRRL